MLRASKVMLKILQVRLQQNVNWEIPDSQAGLRKGRGTRDQTAMPGLTGQCRELPAGRRTCSSPLVFSGTYLFALGLGHWVACVICGVRCGGSQPGVILLPNLGGTQGEVWWHLWSSQLGDAPGIRWAGQGCCSTPHSIWDAPDPQPLQQRMTGF